MICLSMISASAFPVRKKNSKGTDGTAFRKAYGELAVLRSLCKEGLLLNDYPMVVNA